MTTWPVYTGAPDPHDGIERLPEPPNWRRFKGGPPLPIPVGADSDNERRLGHTTVPPDRDEQVVSMVNAALFLRRPLLVTGRPGTGKSSLAYAVARELKRGPVLRWPITSRSTLAQGLYHYDPIARLGDENIRQTRAKNTGENVPPEIDIGRYIRLGPLGTALLPYEYPRVLLIDEIDKSDIDLPNDLLNVFEEGEYDIPELSRLSDPTEVTVRTADRGHTAPVEHGLVRCLAFPFIVLTSNGERDFPAAFLRRCLRLTLEEPSTERLAEIVASHLGQDGADRAAGLIEEFDEARGRGLVATDQLLNAVYLSHSSDAPERELEAIRKKLMRDLSAADTE